MGAVCCGGKSEAVQPKTAPVAYRTRSPIKTQTEQPRYRSAPAVRENFALERFGNIGFSRKNRLKLIDGYENERLVSLEEALQPFDGKIDQLSYYIKEAKTKCRHPSEHNLTRDESAAIYIYTMKWRDRCLYDHLEAAWNSEDPSKLKPWFRYLRLFKSALDKLPIVRTEVWQGAYYDEKIKEKLNTKPLILYTSMSSCSPSVNEIKDFLQKNPDARTILIGYGSVNGKSITGYTVGTSREVIVMPGTNLGVAKYIVNDSNGSVIAHLVGQSGK